MKHLLIIITLLFITGCISTATNVKKTRVTTNVDIKVFNSLSSDYVNRPTFAVVDEYDYNNRHVKSLNYSANGFGSTYLQGVSYPNKSPIWVNITEVDTVISYIDKFIEWETKAKSKGDMFSKDIGQFDSHTSSSITFKYSFFSGNKFNHYLVVSYCSNGMGLICSANSESYLDVEEANTLKEELLKFKSGEVKIRDIASDYT
jgi:hypothetical protein